MDRLPLYRPPAGRQAEILEASRLRVLKRLEQGRRSRVIALVHRQETMSLLGFPIMRYIDVNDSEEVLRAKGSWPTGRIENFTRGILWKIVRQYSLARLPKSLQLPLFRLGICYPSPVVVWSGKEWEIITGFTV